MDSTKPGGVPQQPQVLAELSEKSSCQPALLLADIVNNNTAFIGWTSCQLSAKALLTLGLHLLLQSAVELAELLHPGCQGPQRHCHAQTFKDCVRLKCPSDPVPIPVTKRLCLNVL